MFCSSEDHWRTDGCSAAGAEAGRILLLPRRLSPSRDGFSVRDVRALQHNLRLHVSTRDARDRQLDCDHLCSDGLRMREKRDSRSFSLAIGAPEDTLYIQDSSQCGTQSERSRRL